MSQSQKMKRISRYDYEVSKCWSDKFCLNFAPFFLHRTFEDVLIRSRNELQQAIVAPNGVTLFIPINEAFRNLPSYNNLLTNQSLINRVRTTLLLSFSLPFRVSMIIQGCKFPTVLQFFIKFEFEQNLSDSTHSLTHARMHTNTHTQHTHALTHACTHTHARAHTHNTHTRT